MKTPSAYGASKRVSDMKMARGFFITLFFITVSASLMADPLDDLSDLDDLDEQGFDDSYSETVNTGSSNFSIIDESDLDLSINTYISFYGAYNFAQSNNPIIAPGDTAMDFTDLSRAKIKTGLSIDTKHNKNWRSKLELIAWHDTAWKIKGKESYTQEVLDSYETFTDLREVYIQGALTENLDIKFGRQLVVWGKSDSIRITDVINPLDNRNPGIIDIEDLRLTELMTRLDYYFGHWSLSGIIIHEPRLELEPAFGSDYRPSNIFGSPIPYAQFPDRIKPAWKLDNAQYAISLDGHFSGWDISYYTAHIYSSQFNIKRVEGVPVRFYETTDMLGFAGNFVSGAWLFKAESALNTGINYRSTTKKNRLDMLLGFDYMGVKDTVISLEVANRHIFNHEEVMLSMTLEQARAQNTFPDFVRKNSLSTALRASYSFNHNNATLNYLLFLNGGNVSRDDFDGGFQRLWLDYQLSDTLTLNSGLIDYIGGHSPIPFYRAIENNDRLFAEIRLDF